MKNTNYKIKSNIRIMIIIGMFIILFIIGYTFFNTPIKYYLAKEQINAQQYNKAIQTLSEIEHYKDSSLQIMECKYLQAQELYYNNDFTQAATHFNELNDYKDSDELAKDSYYELAKYHILNLEYQDAIDLLENQISYKDSQKILQEANYLLAKDYASEHKYKSSIDILVRLGVYNDSVDLLQDYKYELAKEYYIKGDFSDSQKLFEDIEDYEDANDYIENLEQLIKLQGTWVQSSYQQLIFDGWKISHVYFIDAIGVRSEILKLEDEKIVGFHPDTPQHGYDHKPQHSYSFLQDNELLVQNWSYVPTKGGEIFVKINTDTSVPKPSSAPYIGMTIRELQKSSWGKPQDINRTTTKYGIHEQWVYSGYRYVYVEDGIVTAIQD